MDTAQILSLVGILIGLVFTMYLTYKGWSVIIICPVAACIMFAFSGMNPLVHVTTTYVTGATNMFKSMFLLYVACFMFAKVMTVTKSCYSIGHWLNKLFGVERATTALIVFAIILRLGGLNVGVYMVVYIMGLYMFKEANYSEDLLLAICIAGTWTFCNSSPFFPGNHNILLQGTLGTPNSAGLIPGMATMAVEVVFIVAYFEITSKRWRKKGRAFSGHAHLPSDEEMDPANFPPVWKGMAPLVGFVIFYNVFNIKVAVALIFSSFICVLLNWNKMPSASAWCKTMEDGAKGCLLSLICITAMGGMGTTITSTPFYDYLLGVLTTAPIHPYILTYGASALMGFLLASGMSACSTCLPMFQPLFETWCATMGLDMGVFHRLMVGGAVAFNTWPHNGVMCGMIDMYNTTYKKSLPSVMIAGTLIPIIVTTCVMLPLALLGFK